MTLTKIWPRKNGRELGPIEISQAPIQSCSWLSFMSWNIPSSLEVNWYPYSVFSLEMKLRSASSEVLFWCRSRCGAGIGVLGQCKGFPVNPRGTLSGLFSRKIKCIPNLTALGDKPDAQQKKCTWFLETSHQQGIVKLRPKAVHFFCFGVAE